MFYVNNWIAFDLTFMFGDIWTWWLFYLFIYLFTYLGLLVSEICLSPLIPNITQGFGD
jgi:hypothetical protein